MVTGDRELSQLDPLHIAGGRREILHAYSRFNRVSSSHIGFMHDEPDRSEFMDVEYHSCWSAVVRDFGTVYSSVLLSVR